MVPPRPKGTAGRQGAQGDPKGGASEQPAAAQKSASKADWTFLTNHAHVLLCLAREPATRMRDVADKVGITERAVQRIVADLEQTGYIQRIREGRRNRYELHDELPLRHPIEQHQQISALLELVLGDDKGTLPG